MKGFNIPERGHYVPVIAPISITAATAGTAFTMAKWAHADILVQAGATNADAGNVTVEACSTLSNTDGVAIPFAYYAEDTANGDTLGARTAATTSGIDVSANDNIFYVISLDAQELPEGKPCVQVKWSAPGGATLICVSAALTGARYSGAPTAIA
jgi:hypothetical protein